MSAHSKLKYQLIVKEYLANGLNKTEALRSAYPKMSDRSLNCYATKVFNTPQVKAMLDEITRKLDIDVDYLTCKLRDEIEYQPEKMTASHRQAKINAIQT